MLGVCAAAVLGATAAGLCFGSLGTDTAGSVRIPAFYCGIVGFKSTYGRVSNRGVVPLSWTLDHVGPLCRTVADAELMLGVIAGYACPANWALTLRHRTQYANWTGRSKVRWGTLETGFRQLHIIVKLADGTWLVSDESTGASKDWKESEFLVVDLHWRKLDIENIIEGTPVEKPDLTRVEIGFTDMMGGMPSSPGSSSPASSRLDWIEVHAFATKRGK